MAKLSDLLPIFENWIRGPNFRAPYSAHTIKAYTRVARDFLSFLESEGVETLDEVNAAWLRKFFFGGTKEEYSASSTVGVRMAAIDLLFVMATESGHARVNPVIDFKDALRRKKGGQGGREGQRLPVVLNWDEQEALMRQAMFHNTIAGYRDAALIGLILDAGLRREEVCALRLADADAYFAGRMRVIGKGNKERLVLFTPHHADRMRSWLIARRRIRIKPAHADLLFLTDEGNPLLPDLVYQQIRRLLSRAGIKKPQSGPHLLRHTAASRMLAEGVNIRRVQENMGHTTVATTSRYLHLLD